MYTILKTYLIINYPLHTVVHAESDNFQRSRAFRDKLYTQLMKYENKTCIWAYFPARKALVVLKVTHIQEHFTHKTTLHYCAKSLPDGEYLKPGSRVVREKNLLSTVLKHL